VLDTSATVTGAPVGCETSLPDLIWEEWASSSGLIGLGGSDRVGDFPIGR